MHEVIGRGAAVIRKRKGWTQEQAARAYREHGLAAWRTSTVGSLEAGMRHPGIGDVLLMCAALNATLDDLLRAASESGECTVELAPGVTVGTQALRDRLRGGGGWAVTQPVAGDAAPTEAERYAARRVGTSPAEVRRAAIALWSRNFDEERDARIEGVAAMTSRSRQARRGHVSRQMLAEIGRELSLPR